MRQPVRPRVQLRIAQRLPSEHHRHRIRRALRLLLYLPVHRLRLHVHCLSMARKIRSPGHGQRDAAERRTGIARQRCQLLVQRLQQESGGARIHVFPCMAQHDGQWPAVGDDQRHGVIGFLPGPQPVEFQAERLCVAQHAIDRVVLEHHDAVEVGLRALSSQALDVLQRQGFVLARGQITGLQHAQPVSHRHVRRHVHGHGQRIDEHAHGLLSLGQLVGPARHRGAEAHRVAAQATGQNMRPCTLHQRVERDVLRARPLRELVRTRRIDLKLLLALACAILPARQSECRPGGFTDASDLGTPIAARSLGIVPRQPVDVIAILAGGRGDARTAVLSENLAQHLGRAPAIHQQMVVRPDEMVASVRTPHQYEPHQGRLGQVEAPVQLLLREPIQGRLDVGMRSPVVVREGRRNATRYPLQRHIALQEPGAQRFMAHQRRLPGLFEARRVQPRDVDAQLVDVRRAARIEGAVEQHALLHGTERIQVLHRLQRQGQSVQILLRQAGQREIAGRCTSRATQAMRRQRDQCLAQALQQAVHRRRIMPRRAVRQVQGQAPVQHLTVQCKLVFERCGRVLAGTDRLLSGQPLRAAIEAAVELPQIVEEDLRTGQPGQRGALRLGAEVAQQPVVHAVVRHGAQPLLDALDRRTGGTTGIQHHRMHGGEPAHRARHIQPVAAVPAPVALQVDPHARLAGPGRNGLCQRGQQEVIGLRAVRGRSLLEQRRRLLHVQHQGLHGGIGQRVCTFRPGTRQRGPRDVRQRQPVRRLAAQLLPAGVLGQRPVLVAGGLGGQHHITASARLFIGRLQVFQEDAP
ncbi:hypothetical protein ACAN107058_19965 [Paracidovorax anthurii]